MQQNDQLVNLSFKPPCDNDIFSEAFITRMGCKNITVIRNWMVAHRNQ